MSFLQVLMQGLAMSCHVLPCLAMSCHVLPCLAMSCLLGLCGRFSVRMSWRSQVHLIPVPKPIDIIWYHQCHSQCSHETSSDPNALAQPCPWSYAPPQDSETPLKYTLKAQWSLCLIFSCQWYQNLPVRSIIIMTEHIDPHFSLNPLAPNIFYTCPATQRVGSANGTFFARGFSSSEPELFPSARMSSMSTRQPLPRWPWEILEQFRHPEDIECLIYSDIQKNDENRNRKGKMVKMLMEKTNGNASCRREAENHRPVLVVPGIYQAPFLHNYQGTTRICKNHSNDNQHQSGGESWRWYW